VVASALRLPSASTDRPPAQDDARRPARRFHFNRAGQLPNQIHLVECPLQRGAMNRLIKNCRNLS
jgi:hypothetical protein